MDVEILVCGMRQDAEGNAGLVDSNPDDKGEPDFYDILVKEVPSEENWHKSWDELLEIEDLTEEKAMRIANTLSFVLGEEITYI